MVLEGKQYGAVVPWLKNEKSMRGRARIKQVRWYKECVCVSVWVNINIEMKYVEVRTE